MVSSSSIEFSETVATSDSVLSLKEKLLTTHAEKVTGATSAEEVVLIFGGRFLTNNEKIADINGGKAPVEDKTTLHVMVRPKAEGSGGGKGGGAANARGCCVVM